MKIRKSFSILIATLLITTQSVPTTAAVTAKQEQVTVGFSPSGTAPANVLNVINRAQSEICVAAYSFTSKAIATALLAAKKRGGG
ncbi:endonuclease [Candidatus Regiella insecticola]|uniref:endonuclease n=1 Tax=Candidatus Regiella insecticola TaxID=138073 RepID=UPI001F2564D6|nr:endonuclease [Candidatus Regiella insecticola]